MRIPRCKAWRATPSEKKYLGGRSSEPMSEIAIMRIIRLKEVMHKTGLARSTIYKYMADKRFPISVQLSEHSVGWVESEINDWIVELISQRG